MFHLFPICPLPSNNIIVWDSGEPGGGIRENCLLLSFTGKLHDGACINMASFNVAACEITMILPGELPATVRPTTAIRMISQGKTIKCIQSIAIIRWKTKQ